MTKILVVDDSVTMRKVLSTLLTEAKYQVIEAEDGQDALTKAQNEKINGVVSDVIMPQMDGITLVQKLRDMPQYKSIPILLITSETSKAAKEKGQAAGASGWLEKPFLTDQLLSTLKHFLE